MKEMPFFRAIRKHGICPERLHETLGGASCVCFMVLPGILVAKGIIDELFTLISSAVERALIAAHETAHLVPEAGRLAAAGVAAFGADSVLYATLRGLAC